MCARDDREIGVCGLRSGEGTFESEYGIVGGRRYSLKDEQCQFMP